MSSSSLGVKHTEQTKLLIQGRAQKLANRQKSKLDDTPIPKVIPSYSRSIPVTLTNIFTGTSVTHPSIRVASPYMNNQVLRTSKTAITIYRPLGADKVIITSTGVYHVAVNLFNKIGPKYNSNNIIGYKGGTPVRLVKINSDLAFNNLVFPSAANAAKFLNCNSRTIDAYIASGNKYTTDSGYSPGTYTIHYK